MKRNILIPIVLLASSPFVVSCTNKTTEAPAVTPPVTGKTETVESTNNTETPVINPTQTPVILTGANAPTPVTFTRTQVVTYATPASPQDPVEFSITITDWVITQASATAKSDNNISQTLQTAFAAEVSAKVVGKKAADLDVDVIGGSSLTTAAFETFARSF